MADGVDDLIAVAELELLLYAQQVEDFTGSGR
jgi:hypothetical protein